MPYGLWQKQNIKIHSTAAPRTTYHTHNIDRPTDAISNKIMFAQTVAQQKKIAVHTVDHGVGVQ